MDPSSTLIIGGFICLAIFGLMMSHIFSRRRTEAMKQISRETGLQFVHNAEIETVHIQSRFDLFTRGRSRRATNLIYGETNGTGVWIFDYRYTTGSGKHSKTHRQTIACYSSEQLSLPRFTLYREGILSKFGSAVFGMQDIDFDSHPVFSDSYVLKGDSEDQIRAAFQPSVLTYFESQDKHLRVEGYGNLLLVYRASRSVKPEQIQEFMAEGFGIYREFLQA